MTDPVGRVDKGACLTRRNGPRMFDRNKRFT